MTRMLRHACLLSTLLAAVSCGPGTGANDGGPGVDVRGAADVVQAADVGDGVDASAQDRRGADLVVADAAPGDLREDAVADAAPSDALTDTAPPDLLVDHPTADTPPADAAVDGGCGVGGGDPATCCAELVTLFEVRERSGIARPDGLVEAGIPFAAGVVTADLAVAVCDAGELQPAHLEPASFWSDGSVRWASIKMPVALAADETRTLALVKTAGPDHVVAPYALPQMQLRLTRDGATVVAFDLPTSRTGDSPHRQTQGANAVEVDLDLLTAQRVRVRTHIAQLEGDAVWNDLTLEIASSGVPRPATDQSAISGDLWTAAVLHHQERGPMTLDARETEPRNLLLGLYPSTQLDPYPTDEGFHTSHEVILERQAAPLDLGQRVASPLRISWPPAYVSATGAAGILPPASEYTGDFDGKLAASAQELVSQQELPINRGIASWGDFYSREGLAYMGYFNQEYDPASAFFMQHLHTGDPDALDLPLSMARQFANSCVGLDGGVYQHRSTTYALIDGVGQPAAACIRGGWRSAPEVPATVEEMAAWLNTNYAGAAYAVVRQAFAARLEELQLAGVTDPATLEQILSDWGGFVLADRAVGDDGVDPATLARVPLEVRNRIDVGPYHPRDVAIVYRASALLAPLDACLGTDIDAMYQPFFERYGGGQDPEWDDFPALHFYDSPNLEANHHGSHTLIEMVVWGTLLTGDTHLRRMALRVAEEFVAPGGMVERTIDQVRAMNAGSNHVQPRSAGWTLINLVSLRLLTRGLEPALDAQLEQKTVDLLLGVDEGDPLDGLLAVDPARYKGVIHAAVVSEGLARFHRENREADPITAALALDGLLALTEHFVDTNWDPVENAFYYAYGDPSQHLYAGSALFLHGLAYAAWQTTDVLLRAKLGGVATLVLQHNIELASAPDGAKGIGMQFRNSLRALGPLQLLD